MMPFNIRLRGLKMTSTTKPQIPLKLLKKWQYIVDLLSQLSETPTVLITQASTTKIELLVCSSNLNNPFRTISYNQRCADSYCDSVIRKQKSLLVTNATKTKRWMHAPKVEQGMTFYLGYPLLWPDSVPFGTICVMDLSSDNRAIENQHLIKELQQLINHDLTLLKTLNDYDQGQQGLQQQLSSLTTSLNSKNTYLDEAHTALKVLLRQQENERKCLQQEAYQELGHLLEPFLLNLEEDDLSKKQKNSISEMRQLLQLNQQPSSISNTLFSSIEQTVIGYIQANKSSKEIAEAMHIAKKTVDFHRQNIRKKLNLQNEPVNLNSFLKSQNFL